MSEIFTNILTKIGQQKKALAEYNNVPLSITKFKVGDGNGAYYEPNENQTSLVNTKYTGMFVAGTESQIVINPAAANEVLYRCFIPADVGGFTIRELGLFDADNNLILICKLPAQDKFALASGLYQPLTFTPKIIYTNPQTQAVLTPTSQVVPTTSEVINLIFENVPETICTLPMKNTNGTISLAFDETLKLLNNKLSVELSKIIKIDGSNKATSLLAYASAVSASADFDIPSYKNLKDYVAANQVSLLPRFAINSASVISTTGQPNYLTGTGTTTLTLNASLASPVLATFANGVQKIITTNLTANMTGLTGTFLIRLNNFNNPTVSTYTASNVYIQPYAPSSVANNKWLDTSVKPFVWKLYNGTAWVTETDFPEHSDILLGLVIVASGSITGIVHFPLNHNFVDEINNDMFSFGTVATGSIYLKPNTKHSVIFSGASTVVIPEVPIGQEINIELDIKMSSAVAITWSKSIDWANAYAPPLTDTTQTYETMLTLKAGQTIWEGRWSPKTR